MFIIAKKNSEHKIYSGNSIATDFSAGCLSVLYDPPFNVESPLPGSALGLPLIVFTDGQFFHVHKKYVARNDVAWVFVWDCCTSWYTTNRPLKRQKIAVWYGDVKTFNFDAYRTAESIKGGHFRNTRGSYIR